MAEHEAPVAGILLAAGTSSRFAGRLPKQLIELDGMPLVRRMAERALRSRLTELVVVVGHEGAAVRAALAGLPLRVVDNPDYAEGQSTSVRAGLAALSATVDGVLFLPVDQPALDTATLDLLVTACEPGGGVIVVPTHAGRRGAPVLFGSSFLAELARLRGDEGGRQLLGRFADAVRTVELASARPLEDIDTAADLERLGDDREQ